MKTALLIFCFSTLAEPAFAAAPKPLILENSHFRYIISAEAKNVALVDRATGMNYLRPGPPSACALIRFRGKEHAASAAELKDGRLTLHFADAGINVPLTLRGSPGEPFGACALSLNLITRVDALPALQSELRAGCEKKFGLVGARAAIVAAPMAAMLPALQDTLATASELPVCKVAGPWAREVPFNHGSYLFNFGSLTETNLDDWIQMARSLGFTQIDNHGGGAFFRFGDLELNRKKWPDGWETWQRIVARLHAAGIGSILHTYAFFIDKHSKYVTPVPDGRLDAFRTFTLAEAIRDHDADITVNESTAGMTTVTGFFEHNSTVLHLGDELITFGAVSQQAPWRFTGVKRGAFGTAPSAHEKGAKARHLKECFGLFVPNPETSLFTEIAANHAEVADRCGFDGIYLDAIDGSSILRGGDECWYWADKFVVEIQQRLKRPIGMEMSSMWHHFWQYRTRWQAWDFPQRGHKRFIDLHAEAVNGGLLLPLHLGWWGFQSFNPPQIEPTYPDVMENLGAKLIGWDAGISLTAGVDRQTLRNTPLFSRAVDILRACEELRHTNAFSEAVKAKLREPGKEFALFKNPVGQTKFHRVHSQAQTVALAEPWTLSWSATNPFPAQPIRFRLEALMSVLADTNPLSLSPSDGERAGVRGNSALILADPAKATAESWKRASADGVAFALKLASGLSDLGSELAATNTGKVPRNAAWARLEKRFETPFNLKQHPALGVTVEGDGSGAMLALRLESPPHISYGAVADRYVNLDFPGRRSFTLVETESTRWNDYVWNDGKGPYNVYRETIDFGAIQSLGVWLQNLPPGRETKCRLGQIQALPLAPGLLKNPKLTVTGKTLEFEIELKSGSWMEANGPEDCSIYGPKGEPLGNVKPRGDWPMLTSGPTRLGFSCEESNGPKPRARITVFPQGEEL